MKTIPLSAGYVALVDDGDYQSLSRWNWCASKSRNGVRIYAVRRGSLEENGGRIIRMHRQLLEAPKGLDVDHRDGNGLNCQRDNLRLATRTENAQNQRRQRSHKTSRFKGVSACRQTRLWRATIKLNGKRVHLGYFISEVAAAAAYDAAALRLFGDFAAINLNGEHT